MVILSLVERGWQAAREWSLRERPPHTSVVHLIKGTLQAEVRSLIRPVPQVELVAVSRTLFWPMAVGLFLWHAYRGRLQAVLVDNQRSERRVRAWIQWIRRPAMRVHLCESP